MVNRLGIVGGGHMAAGIAHLAASKGIDVRVVVRSSVSADGCRLRLKRLDMPRDDDPNEGVSDRIGIGTEMDGLVDVEFVIEAIVEDRIAKQAMLATIDEATEPAIPIASTTSSIPIGALAAGLRRPDRLIGMHFFNPVRKLRLVEVVRGISTSDATKHRAEQLAEQLERHAIDVPDRPGFVVNTLLIPYLLAAIRLSDTVSAEAIDSAMAQGCGHPMGPLAVADLIGLDVLVTVADAMYSETRDEALVVPGPLRRLVEAGHLGRKTGRGFHSYARS